MAKTLELFFWVCAISHIYYSLGGTNVTLWVCMLMDTFFLKNTTAFSHKKVHFCSFCVKYAQRKLLKPIWNPFQNQRENILNSAAEFHLCQYTLASALNRLLGSIYKNMGGGGVSPKDDKFIPKMFFFRFDAVPSE